MHWLGAAPKDQMRITGGVDIAFWHVPTCWLQGDFWPGVG